MNFAVNNGSGNSYLVNGTEQDAHFVDYEEGIYVGYRYYETRGAMDEAWYEEQVVYPFGYGLSYTSFDWKLADVSALEGKAIDGNQTYEISVTVTNTGDVAGKDVVELYGHAPYTEGGIEKSEVVLVGFAKTKLLAPGESETLTLSFHPYYLASYDDECRKTEKGGFVLEAGEGYALYVAKNAHDRSMAIPFQVEKDQVFTEAAKDGYQVENRFEEVGDHIETYLSRADFAGTFPQTPTEDDRTVEAGFMDLLTMEAYIGSGSSLDVDKPWYAERKPRQKRKEMTYENTEYKLYDLIGKDYDDPLWDKLLNQLTYEQIGYLIGTGNFNTAEIANIDKPKTTDPDGPAGFTNFMTVIGGTATVYDTCFYASECVIAATWNTELVCKMGEAIGNEALIGNERGDGRVYSGWYAPAVNIHRTPFSGRNWEYYSEDGFLAGRMAASVIEGASEKGVYTYVKHFAVNDQETNRDTNGLITWLSEQSLRKSTCGRLRWL
ncbi:MAG: fibronectin type III-like domain-contianing protein [Lachnospiraceae bacterium]|nr:fibronectin type III-like domain-contianing protein [Lachnospiraceae bacterium]